MSLYKPWYITDMLRDAMQASVANGTKIKFVRMVASQDVMYEKDLPGLTNESMQTITANQITKISSTTTKRDVITATAVFNNFGITTEYKMNTVYLVAEYNGREFLAAIQVANSPYIVPVESISEHAEYTFKTQLGLSNTMNVDLNMDPEALATNEELIAINEKYDALVTKLENEIADLKSLDSHNVKLIGDQQISDKKTFLEKVIGTITKALNAEKLETPRKINGVPFDGTKDINIPVDSDSGWKRITLTKDFEPYGGDPNNIPMYKIRNGVVTVKGVLKPTKTIPASYDGTIIGTLPKEAIGSGVGVASIQQGTSDARWSLDVKSNGQLNFRRYGNSTGLADATPEHWLPFSTTYTI